MKDREIGDFFKMFVVIAEVYKEDLSQSRDRLKIYFELLKPYELPVINEALKEHLKIGIFFPRPAEIIKIIKEKRLKDVNKFPALQEPTIRNEKLDALLKPVYAKFGKSERVKNG